MQLIIAIRFLISSNKILILLDFNRLLKFYKKHLKIKDNIYKFINMFF